MLRLFTVLKYIKGYGGYASLNIICNILFSIFSLFSLVMVKPFLDLLFQDEKNFTSILNSGKPSFHFSAEYASHITHFFLATFIRNYGKAESLFFICIAVFVLTMFKNLARYMAMFVLAPIRNGVVRDLRNKMHEKVLRLPLSFFSQEKKGDILSRITLDVSEIEWSIMQSLELVFREPLLILFSFATLVALSPYLTLYVLLLLPFAGLILALMGKSLKRGTTRAKTALGELFIIMEETLSGLKVIKAFSAESFVGKKFTEINSVFTKLSIRVARKIDLASPLTEVIVTGILMWIMFIGGRMALDETSGFTSSSFIMYIVIASQIIPPIKQVSLAYTTIQKGLASEERINLILEAELGITEIDNPVELKKLTNKIEFRNVSFAYTKGDTSYVLKNINLELPKGKTIALVGPSGSGKTTLCDMIPRFYDCDEGGVYFDGINIKSTTFESLRNQLGIVSQEPVLFNDSIYENIAFGMKEATMEMVREAAIIANADEFIRQLPLGYKSNIGDRGGKLSGGQRQRISIARAILRNPAVLILDEATSALDTENERLVQDALQKLMKNRTTLVIAHRLSTIVNADQIIVLQNGEIIETGTHSELLAAQGVYKKLYEPG